MSVLERWDRKNQRVLEEHNRRPAPTAGEWYAAVAVFVVCNVVFRISGLFLDGWGEWVAGGALALAAGLLTGEVLRRRAHR